MTPMRRRVRPAGRAALRALTAFPYLWPCGEPWPAAPLCWFATSRYDQATSPRSAKTPMATIGKTTLGTGSCCSSMRTAASTAEATTDIRILLQAPRRAGSSVERRGSASDLPRPAHEPLRARQLAEAHRTAGVELLGRDADLRAEAELAAVGEARGGVDHD